MPSKAKQIVEYVISKNVLKNMAVLAMDTELFKRGINVKVKEITDSTPDDPKLIDALTEIAKQMLKVDKLDI